jgi:hypothetical protein
MGRRKEKTLSLKKRFSSKKRFSGSAPNNFLLDLITKYVIGLLQSAREDGKHSLWLAFCHLLQS